MTKLQKISAVFNIIFAVCAVASMVFVLIFGIEAFSSLNVEDPDLGDGLSSAFGIVFAIISAAANAGFSLIGGIWSFPLAFTSRAPEGKAAVVFKVTFIACVASLIISVAMVALLLILSQKNV